MTRLWIFSDLHQEWTENAWDPAPHAPPHDVIVVAGDVHTPGTAAIDWLADRFGGERVVYVLGNHDLYTTSDDPFTAEEMYLRTQERGAARGIDVLVDDQVVIDGVRFIGATLWTDQRLGAFSRGHAWNTARRGMNDYKRIRRRRTGRHHNIRVDDTVAMHRSSRAYIESALDEPFDGRTVVVTHHAPAPQSVPADTDLRWCYGSDMTETLMHPNSPHLWVHGHVHRHLGYGPVGYGHGYSCVVANPRGHVEEASGFVPNMVVSV